MTRTDTAALKRAIDLRKLVAETHKLKNGKISCPFHQEKTASCSINKEFYKCFGCGASGDAITWLVEYAQLSFREAVAELERRCGLTAPHKIIPRSAHAAALAEEVAGWYNGLTDFYQAFLEAHPDNEYMWDLYSKHRSATPEEVVAAYRRVRTPWLAEQMIQRSNEKKNLETFFKKAI